MHPSRELTQLSIRKVTQRRAIGGQRQAFAAELGVVTHPFRWLDQWRDAFRRIAPLAPLAMVLGGFLRHLRSAGPRRPTGRWFRWSRVLRVVARGLGILLTVRKVTQTH